MNVVRNRLPYRFIRDVQGSVRLVVDSATGLVAQRLDYDAFGNVLLDTNPGFQPFGFQSGLYDPDTALVQFGARWYDAKTGRWLSKDPILLEGGLNLYVFCGNDPVNFTDPLGLCEDNDTTDGEFGWPWAVLGGMKQNINVNTPYGELSWRSPISLIERALREARTPSAQKALRGLLKVAKRGGTGGTTATRMGGPLLWWLPGLMSDAKVIKGAIERGESLNEGYRREFEDAGPYLLTPFGVIPNVWWREDSSNREEKFEGVTI